MVIASRWAEKPLTSTDAHVRKCHNRRSKPLPLKLFGWGGLVTPGAPVAFLFSTGNADG
ncbi:Uncharacterised protein [Mycobacteroides abscessus subsp. massiliense]|nr:Uncharacterised protein [Mycobacteroides abscessus subsp. massiliense]SKU99984.1 Uncharacterised protein [Mycobacteroides abscessus subsp. massiliense]